MNTNIDPIVPKPDIIRATALSEPTIWREQKAGRFPKFESISARRVGLRLSRLFPRLLSRTRSKDFWRLSTAATAILTRKPRTLI